MLSASGQDSYPISTRTNVYLWMDSAEGVRTKRAIIHYWMIIVPFGERKVLYHFIVSLKSNIHQRDSFFIMPVLMEEGSSGLRVAHQSSVEVQSAISEVIDLFNQKPREVRDWFSHQSRTDKPLVGRRVDAREGTGF